MLAERSRFAELMIVVYVSRFYIRFSDADSNRTLDHLDRDNQSRHVEERPQGLKPIIFPSIYGTTKVVP